MPDEISEEKLKSAFFRTLVHLGLTIFETEYEKYFSNKILLTVPLEKQKQFPRKLRQSAVYICTRSPYQWRVDDSTPQINDNTTFEDLYNQWFKTIIS